LDQQASISLNSEQGASSKTVILVVTAVVFFIISFITSGLNVALPSIGQEFQASAVLLSWVVSAELLSIGVFLMPVGRLSDIVGIKKIFLWGMILFTITCVVAAYSNSIIMLIAVLAVRGISCAMIFGNAMAMLTAAYPSRERGRAFGINAACIYTGMSLGPYLGGMLVDHFGWRIPFFVVVPAGIATVALVLSKIKEEWSAAEGEKFDLVGSAIIGCSLIALIYGFSRLPELIGAALTTAGIVGALAFLKWESLVTSPILDVAVFRRNRFFIFSNAANLISYASTSAVIFLLSLYLQYIKGLTPEQAGLVLLAQPVMLVIFSPITGILSDKFEARVVATSGTILILMGLLILCFLAESTSLISIIIALMLTGLGFALFVTPNNSAIMGSISPKYYAVASSVTATLRQIGQTLSMGITMIIMSLLIGKVAISAVNYPEFLTSARLSFGVFAVVAFGCIFVSLSRGKANQAEGS
jgi:EmrB/QacA subfamily drug resistance transporter